MVISNMFLFFLLTFVNTLQGTKAILKTTFIEDYCFMKPSATLNLLYERSGILVSVPRYTSGDFFLCELTLQPPAHASVVLSIYSYAINPDDSLIIQDSDKHTIALHNRATFEDEKKSIISDGKLIIKFTKKNSLSSFYATKSMFQFTFTLIHNSPCVKDEYQCRNGKCLAKNLLCDGHNHCGDQSDQINCAPITPETVHPVFEAKSSKRYRWMVVGIVVASSIILIIILAFIVRLIRNKGQKPKGEGNQNRAAPLQSVSASVQTQPSTSNDLQRPTETFYNRVRRSFRGAKRTEVEVPMHQEAIQVPSMYPNLEQSPSAPELSAAENPAFKEEE